MKKACVTWILLIVSVVAFSQDSEDDWQRYLNQTGELEDVEGAGWESAHEVLTELAEHPIDINTATREDLQQLPFLTEQEVEEISEYVCRYAPLKSMGELAMVHSLTPEKRQMLSQFLYIGEERPKGLPSVKKILEYGDHTLMATGKIPFYKRKGDDEGYLGYPYRHNLRYTFNYDNAVKIGLLGAQDAGEPFFANKNGKGYDFYSFYAVLRNMGRLKSLALGRYRVSFGSGLVINSDFSLGKMGLLSTLGRQQNNIRAHSSTAQANYLQGAAATVQLVRGLDLCAFASWRKIDATLNEGGFIQTIRTDGYHRTQSEMDKKENASQTVFGGHLNYSRHGFHVGTTGTFTRMDRDLQPATAAIYRHYYAHGNNIWNVSADYGYVGSRVTVNGETATGSCGALATLNTLSWRTTSSLSLMAVQRFYSKRYYSLFSQSFSEGGRVQNESGLYVGAVWQPLRQFQLTAYTDFSYFPWPRYQVGDSSHAWDHLLQTTWSEKRWKFGMRYRLKRVERDNADKTGLTWKNEHRGRLSADYDAGVWSSHTQGDMAYSSFGKGSFGWMLSEQLQVRHRRLCASVSVAYFRTDDFDSRLYCYEQGMLYSYNFPVFYGEGIRYWLQVRADVSKRLKFTAKLGTTDYFDRLVISSGYQKINHSSMTDLEMQLRWKF